MEVVNTDTNTNNTQSTGGTTGTVAEIKIGPGIYFTDYRKPTTEGTNQCQVQFTESKAKPRELSTNPEILAADFKDSQIRVKNMKYSITEIEAFEGFEKDPDLISAIDEDYELIVKYCQEQIKILEQLERVDNKNYLLKNHNVKDLETEIQTSTDKHKEFQSKYLNKSSVFI
eukprot:CAMPEP_0176449136 /NCGR_PEP_ID=MMETSP0127-20121128/26261_1 /TAXON_ID=938130 /ORGANISM="Platyophrya macrostoma, Strain WH" /LENGTH=171 /DNA_ID=CAMNT_0017836343 /DNA_START=6 /DNA_END=521 /DNA_ORIENTATION=-